MFGASSAVILSLPNIFETLIMAGARVTWEEMHSSAARSRWC
jgi:hypothetical protein